MLGDGKTRAKICPDCGQHNSLHALWCIGCERMLSVKTIVKLEAEVPDSRADSRRSSDRRTVSGRKRPVGQLPEPSDAATLPSDRINGPKDPGAPSRSHGGPETPAGEPSGGKLYEFALIPEDPRRAGCLSLWLMGVMVANGFGFILMLREGRLDPIACGLCLVTITFAVALWHLRKWGAYGLAASFGLAFVLGVVVQDFYTIVSSIVPMVLLVALVKPKWDMLE